MVAAARRSRRQPLRPARASATRQSSTVIRSAGVALVAALALAPASGVAATADAEPTPASAAAAAVDVTVVGTPDDEEHVRGLAVSRALGGRVRWLRVDAFEPASVLADVAAAGDAAVRVWIDMTDPRRARLTFATRSERFLIRDVELSGRFDEVDRAALAEVLELSVGALMDNERAGLSRDEAQALLARREPPDAPLPAPAPLPPPPPLADPVALVSRRVLRGAGADRRPRISPRALACCWRWRAIRAASNAGRACCSG